MIVSRGNLQAVVNTTKQPPVLNNVYFEDGMTVAFNGQTIAVVGPVQEATREEVFVTETPNSSMTISAETVKEVLKNLPVDKLTGGLLEHCDVDPHAVFRLTDGKRKRTIAGKVYKRDYIPFRTVLQKARESEVVQRIELNRHRLRTLLEFMDKACPDASGEAPVYLEFTSNHDVIMRAVNPRTGQRALGYMSSYKDGEWLEPDSWERNLTSEKPRRAARRRNDA